LYGRGYRSSGGFGFGPTFTPPIVQRLLIANVAVFLAQVLAPGIDRVGALSPIDLWRGGYLWQPFTYMWLHGGLAHLLINMFVLWMFGAQLAMAWGPRRFLRYYLICGVGAGIIIGTVPFLLVGLHAASPYILAIPTVGASGAIYGVLLAYSLTWPDRTIMLIFPPVAFRAIWLIPITFFLTWFFGGPNISHIGHLGGILVGWIYLRSQGDTSGRLITWEQLKYKVRRWRMRRRLRAVQYEEWETRRREHDRRYH
jgi:membrane associated rhomboid family serine protease